MGEKYHNESGLGGVRSGAMRGMIAIPKAECSRCGLLVNKAHLAHYTYCHSCRVEISIATHFEVKDAQAAALADQGERIRYANRSDAEREAEYDKGLRRRVRR